MRDSMHILDQLRQRGYEPQDEARDTEGWFDRHYPDARKTIRVVLTDEGNAGLFGFDRYMCLEWDASFQASTPPSVFLAALDAAEREAEPKRCSVCGHVERSWTHVPAGNFNGAHDFTPAGA